MFKSLNFGAQAEANRDLARRARRLADTLSDPADRRRLLRYADELDEQAARREAEAAAFRSSAIEPMPANDPFPASD
jgi:hypothetical protein